MNTALVPFNPYEYRNVPEEFKSSKNKWNELAHYIIHVTDTAGNLNDLRIDPWPGRDWERGFETAVQFLRNQDVPEYHRAAVAAWLFATVLKDFHFYYD